MEILVFFLENQKTCLAEKFIKTSKQKKKNQQYLLAIWFYLLAHYQIHHMMAVHAKSQTWPSLQLNTIQSWDWTFSPPGPMNSHNPSDSTDPPLNKHNANLTLISRLKQPSEPQRQTNEHLVQTYDAYSKIQPQKKYILHWYTQKQERDFHVSCVCHVDFKFCSRNLIFIDVLV